MITELQGVFDRAVLASHLSHYKNVNDKVHRMIKDGELIQLKRGAYVLNQAMRSGQISSHQIANALYGPSYVSFFTALSYHGYVPERVVTIESATLRRSKDIDTELGLFQYFKMASPSFSMGIQYQQFGKVFYMMASPTKALLDILWKEPILNIYGVNALRHYLVNDLRIDEQQLADLDITVIRSAIQLGKRKRIIRYLERLVIQLNESQ